MPAATRSVPNWLADVVQDLELNGRTVVTVRDIRRGHPDLGANAGHAVEELARRGWLQHTGVRGTYEFIPGSAAGPYPSGDPWLVLRAELLRDISDLHVGANSAAWLLGYAQRSPDRHILVARFGMWVPRALRTNYAVLTTDPAPAHGKVDGLPVPTSPELFAEVAQLATRLPIDSAQGWLRRLLEDVPPGELIEILKERNIATRARAGYIAETCGATEHAAAIESLGLPTTGPFFTGKRNRQAPYSAKWRVYDTGLLSQQ